MRQQVFKLVLMEEADKFLDSLTDAVYEKIDYNIRKVAAGVKDSELFKKLKNSEIWEFRTLYGGISYRLFAFWDTDVDTLVIATHGLMKKTQKTPPKEIAKAERIRKLYFEQKKNE
ncbi:MAG: type II toxin-antitoxin system RelE/ParE family toxin [Muribaculaceae bacterium]|nr:type II toxin-antitoxin system RelE/ParE family toxin [Muribaculaceae bacterium]